MSNPVDHEAIQAAQALCMLALDTRQQQNVDPAETEDDDCIITHVRPVVHRHHPYRRPEPQQVSAAAARSRMSANAQAQWMAIEREYLHRDNWNIFPLQEHEAQPGAPVPEVRRVVINGVAVPVKVTLPHTQPSVVPRSTPVQQPDPTRRPLPDRRPSPIQQPPPGSLSSPSQPPARTDDDASPVTYYSVRSLALQALLAAPNGEWLSANDMADYIEEKYPQFREAGAGRRLRHNISAIVPQLDEILETSESRDGTTPTWWRLPAWARKTAGMLAWKVSYKRSSPSPDFETQLEGQAVSEASYTPKSLVLQALLAAEGQWVHASNIVDYLRIQYPQLRGSDRSDFMSRLSRALNQSLDLVEKSWPQERRYGVLWRLRPGALEEAARLAWPERSMQNATH